MKDEFEKFCENYIRYAEEEWDKTNSQVDLAAATVAKIMLNKYKQCHEAMGLDVCPWCGKRRGL